MAARDKAPALNILLPNSTGTSAACPPACCLLSSSSPSTSPPSGACLKAWPSEPARGSSLLAACTRLPRGREGSQGRGNTPTLPPATLLSLPLPSSPSPSPSAEAASEAAREGGFLCLASGTPGTSCPSLSSPSSPSSCSPSPLSSPDAREDSSDLMHLPHAPLAGAPAKTPTLPSPSSCSIRSPSPSSSTLPTALGAAWCGKLPGTATVTNPA